MKYKIAKTNSPAAVLRRAALVGGLALTAALASLPHAGAQSPVVSSPGVPTPYSWPNFHAGGVQLPQVNSADTALAGQYYTLPDTYAFANPLAWQLNGTPTALVTNGTTTTQTEIPSFVLGNFNPTQGPSGPVNTFFRNHFRDGGIYPIAGPFAFNNPNLFTPAEVVDDLEPNTANLPPNGFAILTGTWGTVSSTGDTTGGTYTTATNQEYRTTGLAAQDVTSTTANPLPTAQWTITPNAYNVVVPPATTVAPLPTGFYTLMVHLPNSPDAATNSTATTPLIFSQDAHYQVRLNSTTATPIADVRIAQGVVNDQVLAGPFLLQPSDILYVTLDNSTKLVQSANTVVVADAISLVPSSGGDVESAPAAVSVGVTGSLEYPEIANAEYFGVMAGTDSTLPPTNQPTTPDQYPSGNTTINQTPFDLTQNVSSNPMAQQANHRIRQLVYFGRLETVVQTQTTGGVTAAVTNPMTGAVITQQVGAIYCMDGFTGGIVWRYQTPGTYDNLGNVTGIAGPVFSSPAVARLNVRVDPSSTSTAPFATKLVVVIADNRGFVYCLDAVGNRDGTSNSNAVYQSTTTGQPNYIADPHLNGLPIFNPGIDPTGKPIYTAYTGLGDFGTTTTDPPHEGNTTAYWVYRPDATRPKYVTGSNIGKIKTTPDPNSDLPVPGAFGLASPTIYTKGYVQTDLTTDYPTATPLGSTTLTQASSNSIIYIGNGNGVLYALDGLGYPVTPQTDATTGIKYADSPGDPFNAALDIENKLSAVPAATSLIPTPKPLWWFSIRDVIGDPATTSTATIESAPAVFVSPKIGTLAGKNHNVNVTVYVTSAHESSAVASSGRLYALDGIYGPSGNGGKDDPITNGNPAGTTYQGPGSLHYNSDQRPKLPTDTTAPILHWSFPDAYGTGLSSNKRARPALGNITGSPVVFANTKQPVTGLGGQTYPTVNIYIAANSGPEVDFDSTGTNQTAVVPDDNTSGRIWKVNTDGSVQWAYPTANDPNNATLQNTAEPSPPMGAFLHAAPAMGYVQFPAQIIEGNGNTYARPDQHNANIVGLSVPMLYIATSGYDDALAGPGFYSLDIDNDSPYNSATPYGNNTTDAVAADDAREVEAIASPSGESFVSSPALVTNPSLTPLTVPANGGGNGGAVYVVGSAGTLVQFGATPITNNFGATNFGASGDTSNQPYFPVDKQLPGFGPVSAPSLSAADVLDLSTTTTGFFAANNVLDRVFIGSSNGLCYGLTPAGLNGGGFDPGTVGPPIGPGTGGEVQGISNQFILHSYIATVPAQKDFTATDVKSPTTSTATPFEWGENVYIRFTNVVPPASPNGTVTYKVYDPTDTTGGYYANGQPVTFQISSSSPTGGTSVTPPTSPVPAVLVNPGNVNGPLPGNGFVLGTDTNVTNFPAGALTTDATGTAAVYSATNASVWVAATTFPVRNEEPGAQHRLISATQVASHYAKDGTFLGSVTLQATVGQGTQFANAAGTALIKIPPVTQPVFAVLNPLAVRGAGIPIAFNGAKPAEPIGNFTNTVTDGVGPFRGLSDRSFASGNTFDLQALTNGNRVYTVKAPPASVSGTITGSGGGRRRQRLQGYPERNVRVTTSTGLVNHNSTGSNADPNATTAMTLLGSSSNNTNNGLTPPTNAPYGQYTLDVTDRSALGLAGLSIANLRMERNALGWNDNTGLFGNNATNGPTNGAGAAINPLPWDDTPVTGSNHSRDYPDIRQSALADILNNTDITAAPGTPDPARFITDVDHRNVVADPVKVQVSVPRYQPANLQFYDQNVLTPITPDSVNPKDDTFPMGYVNTVRVFVDSNNNGRLDPGEAYRSVQVFSGVPVDMSTSIDTPTTDLGKLPQGFGLQTDNFNALGTFMPYPTQTQIGNSGTNPGNWQNPGYVSFFKPVQASNRGNTNLLNVHLDQKTDTTPGQTQTSALSLVGDPLAASLDAADLTGSTGPRTALPFATPTVMAQPFLIRSSLDSDLVAAYGRNPSFGTPYNALGATFHKSRVGDANPSVLTVPDVPHDNDTTQTGTTSPNLAPSDGKPLAVNNNGVLVNDVPYAPDPNNPGQTIANPNYGKPAASIPYVALAIPQGTPVGTYTTRLQLFEGVDPSGYKNIYGNGANTGPYVPILPPLYGTKNINQATDPNPTFGKYSSTAVATDFYGNLVDTLIAPNKVPSVPYSNGTVIKATVTEARITDGASRGDLPQVDAQGATGTAANPLPSADFLPSAFRDPTSGNVSLYWTSARTQPTLAYGLFGANLSANNNTYFKANTSNNWWSQITLSPPLIATTGTVNSAISVVPTGTYAFVHTVTGGTAGAPVGNNLLCYQVTPGTGALTGTGVPVTLNTSQAIQGARGLTTTGAGFTDALDTSANPAPVSSNLWAFWTGGARNRSAISYASSTANGGTPAAFGPTATLPIPAGLVSVSDPVAVLSYAPISGGGTAPVLEVTYTGIAPDGNADIYVSRYRPYYVRQADNKTLATDANGNNIIALGLLPSPPINEQLNSTDGGLYYQARDVAWARNGFVNVFVGATSLLRNLGGTVNADGSYPLNNGVKETFDRTTNTLVYTAANPSFPNVSVGNGGQTVAVNAVYVDLARGRVRFSFTPQVSAAAGVSAYATFTPQARRITTDTRADTAPVAFLDNAPKPNEAGFNNANLAAANQIPNVLNAGRYWYIWRKSGASGTSTTPTLFYKTQRLTIALHTVTAAAATNNQPVSLLLNANKQPANLTVTDNTTGATLYDSTAPSTALVDVDWVRGRIYFPVTNAAVTHAFEGDNITVKFDAKDSNNNTYTGQSITDNVHWLDEPRYNEGASPSIASGTPITGRIALTAAATGDAAIPIDTVANESNVTAFLDPSANAARPHKVWLFWNSTRNGTADIYYETISPLFSAATAQ